MRKNALVIYSELTPLKPFYAVANGVDLVVVRWNDKEKVSVLYGRCAHRGALMADGFVDGDNLIYKKYFNIGFAADTPNGLVVPVVRDADQIVVVEDGRIVDRGSHEELIARGGLYAQLVQMQDLGARLELAAERGKGLQACHRRAQLALRRLERRGAGRHLEGDDALLVRQRVSHLDRQQLRRLTAHQRYISPARRTTTVSPRRLPAR